MAQYTALTDNDRFHIVSPFYRAGAETTQDLSGAREAPGSPLRGVGIALLLEAAVGSLGFLVWFAVHIT